MSRRKYDGVSAVRGEVDYGGARRSEIARALGISRARVGQIERQALAKLRKAMRQEGKER